jgi:hypothetical protein
MGNTSLRNEIKIKIKIHIIIIIWLENGNSSKIEWLSIIAS